MAATIALGTAVAVHAQNRIAYVDTAAPSGGNGYSWQTAYNDLQLALLLVERPNYTEAYKIEFRIAAGTYKPDLGTGNRNIPFYVQQGDTLIGGYGGLRSPDPNAVHPDLNPTILSADLAGDDALGANHRTDNSKQLLRVDPVSYLVVASALSLQTLFRNLELVGVDSGEYGTPVVASYGLTTMSRCVFRDSSCGYLYGRAGGPDAPSTFYACTFENNLVGGGFLYSVGSLTNCVVRGNRSIRDSSFLTFDPSAGTNVVANSLIVDNSNFRKVFESFSALALSRCTIAGNTLSGNVLSTTSPNAQISNCIIAENVIQFTRSLGIGCSPNVLSGPNIFARGSGDIGSSSPPGACNYGVPPIADPHPFANRSGADQDPLTWQDNDYRPRWNGPAIDAAQLLTGASGGDVHFSLPFDVAEVANSGTGSVSYVDIGAVEYHASGGNEACPADFNRSGAVTVQDVFDYLTAYFGGCP